MREKTSVSKKSNPHDTRVIPPKRVAGPVFTPGQHSTEETCGWRAVGDADTALMHHIDQHASHCMGKMSESDFGFEYSESEPIERNCRFDHLSAKHFRFEDSAPEPIHKHFRFEDSAPEPIQRSVFATPFRPYKGKESEQ